VSLLTKYRPNFCSECGEKIIRLRWRVWTSRQFCNACARRFRKERWLSALLAIAILLCLGFITGRALKPERAQLIIQRGAHAVTSAQNGLDHSSGASATKTELASGAANTQPVTPDEDVYICGARTKKGTPCSRRVHGLVRCWQHKGMPAMLPPEKLIIKD
jgi:hypothetical protein